jgi:hypothetical protein
MALNLLVYYNAATGEAATGGIDELGNHRFLQRYRDFAIDWTHLAATKDRLFYYNASTNAAAIAQLDAQGNHRVLRRLESDRTWTHITATEEHLLFYNATTGEAAIAVIDATEALTILQRYNDFAQGWTNIAAIQNRLLYYNATTTELATAEIDPAGNHRVVNRYPAGTTTQWTSLTATQNIFLFYNINEGGGASCRIDESGQFILLQSFPGFSSGWVQIAGTQRHLLYYNPASPVIATGDFLADGQHRDLFAYSDFATQWTHITALKVETAINPEALILNPTVNLIRPDDLLNLTVQCLNMQLDKSNRTHPVVIPHRPEQPSYLVVTFPPQTTVEQAYFEAPAAGDAAKPEGLDAPTQKRVDRDAGAVTADPPAPGNVAARIGQPSRLVFRIPAEARIPYTTEGLLDWSQWELVVAPIADVDYKATPPDDALFIREPRNISDDPALAPETAIELPYRLQLSPRRAVVWDHALKTVSHLGRTELWHTRLASRTAEGKLQRTDAAHPLPLRAIWSPDFPLENLSPGNLGEIGVLTAMTPYDRKSIVTLTSAFQGYAKSLTEPYVPKPIYASQFMLSALGGWLKSEGAWDPPYALKFTLPRLPNGGIAGLLPNPAQNFLSGTISLDLARQLSRDRFGTTALNLLSLGEQLDLSQWVHVATQGRDHYVRIVYEGRLKPTGHKAALIKVTERRFENQPGTQFPVAYLRQFMYIVVREPERDYRQDGLAHGGLEMPLQKIRLTTTVTPKISYPYSGAPRITDRSFWIMLGRAGSERDFRFHAIGTDVAGNLIDFTIPLIFVPNSEANFAAIETAYQTAVDRRVAKVPGQKVTFAAAAPDKDNTRLTTQTLDFINEGATAANFFKPKLHRAEVSIPAVQQLLGNRESTWIRMAEEYVQNNGFTNPQNLTGVFAKIITKDAQPATVGLKFAAEQAGGFATPSMDITLLSRQLGPLGGDVTTALANQFEPEQFFPTKNGLAKIFGSFDLADLIPTNGSTEKNAPKMQIQRNGTAVTATLDWNPTLKKAGIEGALEFVPSANSQLQIHGVFKKDLGAPSQDDFQLTGKLNDFQLFLLNSVQVNFDLFSFTSQSGKKTDVEVTLNDEEPIKFIGDLEFVEGLRKLIPPGVFGDGVSIDLIKAPLGIRAALSLGLPPAAVGVFALQNIAFTAGMTLPFLEGKPVFDFAFARRDNPFRLTIAFFGGGGFFGIKLDPDGLKSLEASFEFGAAAALSIAIASGEVHIMAGIYFKMKTEDAKTKQGQLIRDKQGNVVKAQVSQLTGYLRCGGKLSVLGLVSVSIEFHLSFTYLSTGKAYGTAILTITVEIFFFEKTFEIKVERSFGKEGNDPLFKQLMDTPTAWGDYVTAFA